MSPLTWFGALAFGMMLIGGSAAYVKSEQEVSVHYHSAPAEFVARASDVHREMLGLAQRN